MTGADVRDDMELVIRELARAGVDVEITGPHNVTRLYRLVCDFKRLDFDAELRLHSPEAQLQFLRDWLKERVARTAARRTPFPFRPYAMPRAMSDALARCRGIN